MPTRKDFKNTFKDALKSGGSWFVFGNALLNGQTDIFIAFAYAALFTTQRVVSHLYADKASSRLGKFLLGEQAPLAFNGIETGIVGAVTHVVHGSPLLVEACTDFSPANFTQAMLYKGGLIPPPTTRRGQLLKSFTLAACDITILHGLSKVAENAGFSSQFSKELVAAGLVFAGIRAFKPPKEKWK